VPVRCNRQRRNQRQHGLRHRPTIVGCAMRKLFGLRRPRRLGHQQTRRTPFTLPLPPLHRQSIVQLHTWAESRLCRYGQIAAESRLSLCTHCTSLKPHSRELNLIYCARDAFLCCSPGACVIRSVGILGTNGHSGARCLRLRADRAAVALSFIQSVTASPAGYGDLQAAVELPHSL